ncbi:metallophosphoesterase family protein [Actinocorallia longicatena]|uniref:Metallophosphoesterase n=1 Tax=Actinocorallia longicatena TaxID=111803 RepID=A0ABP6QLT7_9ACTN
MTTPRNSHRSSASAGWGCQEDGHYRELGPQQALSWLRPSVLWRSRNDVIAKRFGDPVDDIRRRWIGEPGDMLLRSEPDTTFSFLLLGDTGEGDQSQFAVVPGMLKIGQDTDFAVIASDVIYPIGSVNDYPQKFFKPYQDYRKPIYAIPGNHDWYDGLEGFMRVFCDRQGDGSPGDWWHGSLGFVARKLWRRPEPADEEKLAEGRKLRSMVEQQAVQPGPYWVIDSPELRIIGIDTGIQGRLDREQGAWLRRVSADPRPKLLITGKPIYKDDVHQPGSIEGGGTVDEIVREFSYVAVIGGDIHNYQRYPIVLQRDGRDEIVQYVVAGGSGAFMHATHTIARTSTVVEDTFTCYPLRGDSLVFYSRLYGRRLRWLGLRRFFDISYPEAAAAVSERLGIPPSRPEADDVKPGRRARMIASLLGVPGATGRLTSWFRLPVRKAYHKLFSETADSDLPPFFKSFLRIDVTPGELRIRCIGASGCRAHELAPPVEDDFRIPLR